MKKILIVEDEFILQLMLEKMLQKMGYLVVSKAMSGSEAIQIVESEKPDLIIMDIKIVGNLDGIETVTEIRKFSQVPVLYLSGNTDAETRKRAMATEPMDFIIKPFEYEVLEEAINNCFK